MNNFEIKAKLVEEGKSKIFDNWARNAGITKEDFLRELEWLCEDPCDDKGLMTRELGCDAKRGLVRLIRINTPFTVFYEAESRRAWNRSNPSISARDRI